MADAAASPGGPLVSAAKKRRIAALEKSLGAQQLGKGTGAGAGGSAAAGGNSAKRSRQAGERSRGTAQQQAQHASGSSAASRRGEPAQRQATQQQQQQQREEGQEPIYRKLPQELACGPLAQALQLPEPGNDGGRVVGELLEAVLATNPRGLDARAAIGLKVSERAVMLDNPVAPAGRRKAKERRLSRRLATKKQQRELGLYNLAASGITYEQAQPLHQRWRQYLSGLLASASAGASAPQAGSSGVGAGAVGAGTAAEASALLQADMHGCLLRVAESREGRWQGVEGVVLRDSQGAFTVVTPGNRVVTLPKRACTFEFGLGKGRVVRLLGRNLLPAAGPGRRR